MKRYELIITRSFKNLNFLYENKTNNHKELNPEFAIVWQISKDILIFDKEFFIKNEDKNSWNFYCDMTIDDYLEKIIIKEDLISHLLNLQESKGKKVFIKFDEDTLEDVSHFKPICNWSENSKNIVLKINEYECSNLKKDWNQYINNNDRLVFDVKPKKSNLRVTTIIGKLHTEYGIGNLFYDLSYMIDQNELKNKKYHFHKIDAIKEKHGNRYTCDDNSLWY